MYHEVWVGCGELEESAKISMTCKEFRRCRQYQLGAYVCDLIGKDCGKFLNVEIAVGDGS
jgi:hypothetical protein